MLTVRRFCRGSPRGRRCSRDALRRCLSRARDVSVTAVAAKPEGRDPVVRTGLEPLLNGRDLDDPPAADQRCFELAIPDRAPDSPVLTSRHLCHFLDGQVRTVHNHINRLRSGTSYGWSNTKSANYAKGPPTYLPVRTEERRGRRSARRGAVGWRVLEPPDQVLELSGNTPGFVHGLPHVVGIERRPPSVAGDLAFDEPAERDTDRSCAEAGAIRSPVSSLTCTRAIRSRGARARSCARCSRCRPRRPTYTL